MAVTAKLSRRFYETFGDDIANELVEWLNQVDATYRSDFRELFDMHFARFEAKLAQRSAEIRGEMQAGLAEADARLERRIATLRTDLLRWMFIYWAGSVTATIGLVLVVANLLRR